MEEACLEISTFSLNADPIDVKRAVGSEADFQDDDDYLPAGNSVSEVFSRFAEVKRLNHTNLTRFIDIHALPQNRLIISSESYHRSLEQVYAQKQLRHEKFIESELQIITRSVLSALNYLHNKGMSHLWLSPSCMVYAGENVIKLSKHSQQLIFGPDKVQRQKLHYMSPEEVQGLECNPFRSDIWAVGIILLECISLKNIADFDLSDYESILSHNQTSLFKATLGPRASKLQRFLAGEYVKSEISSQFEDFLKQCLTVHNWLDAIDLIDHPWFADMERTDEWTLSPQMDSENLQDEQTFNKLSNMQLNELYYWWLKFNEIDDVAEMENCFISNGLIDYLPPIMAIKNWYKEFVYEDETEFRVKSIKVSIEPLLSYLSDSSTAKPTETIIKPDTEQSETERAGIFSKINPFSFWKRQQPTEQTDVAKPDSTLQELHTSEPEDLSAEFFRMIEFEKLIEKYPNEHQQLFEEVRKGVPELIRPSLWKVLLARPSNVQLWYDFIKHDKLIGEKKCRQIAVDVTRCHQYNRFLNTLAGQNRMETMLKLWLEQNPDLDYMQGLDSLTAPFIVLYPDDEASSYACFSEVISRYLHSYCIKDNPDYLRGQLLAFRNLLNFHDVELGNHFEAQNYGPDFYAIPWILTLYAHVFPIDKLFLLWDELFLMDSSFILYIGIAILLQFRQEALKSDQVQLSQLVLKMPGYVDLNECIRVSKKMYSASPASIASLNVDVTTQWNVERWWESYVPIDIANETTSPFIDVQDAQEHRDSAMFIDVRSRDAFREGNIEQSVQEEAVVLDESELMPKLDPPKSFLSHLASKAGPQHLIIIVGDNSLNANAFAKMLTKQGIGKVCILRGGFDAVRSDAPELIEKRQEETKGMFSRFWNK